jgi:hypothetical protein
MCEEQRYLSRRTHFLSRDMTNKTSCIAIIPPNLPRYGSSTFPKGELLGPLLFFITPLF